MCKSTCAQGRYTYSFAPTLMLRLNIKTHSNCVVIIADEEVTSFLQT